MVIALLATAARQLLAHWPAIMAWFLAGTLANYGVIQVAGWVGAYTAIGGALLLPVGVLARLISYVAMFLIVRDGMRQLDALAPLPETPTARRAAFLSALLGSILPFVAFYAAWGLMRDDVAAYFQRVLALSAELLFADEQVGDGAAGHLSLGVWTIVVIVAAFALRWLLKRYSARLPQWFAFAAVYLEVLWVYLSLMVVSDIFDGITAWVQARQAMAWLNGLREWVSAQLVPVAWLWDAVEWVLGEAGGVILLPLAWLTIAGVVYGQAVAPQRLNLSGALVDRARSRWVRAPGWIRTRLADFWAEIAARFQPIGRVIVLMWRAGPVLIGGYVLLYTVLLALESLVGIGITRVLGPNELGAFWMVNDQLILLAIPLIIEPLRIVLVSASYDQVVGRLVQRQSDAVTDAAAQGSTAMRRYSGSAGPVENSSTNGPDASAGTR